MIQIQTLIFRLPALLIAVTVHEYAHGRVAYALGDPTAKEHGRLSLNPIRHLDPIGSLMVVIFGFGWAKPVPVNPGYFKDPRRGMLLVGIAGPLTNFTAAFALGRLVLPFVPTRGVAEILAVIVFQAVFINIALGIFNLLPIPPLDGSNVLAAFLPRAMLASYRAIERYGFIILILLLTVFGSGFQVVFGPVLEFMVRLATFG